MLIFKYAKEGTLEIEGLKKIAATCDVTTEGVGGAKVFFEAKAKEVSVVYWTVLSLGSWHVSVYCLKVLFSFLVFFLNLFFIIFISLCVAYSTWLFLQLLVEHFYYFCCCCCCWGIEPVIYSCFLCLMSVSF